MRSGLSRNIVLAFAIGYAAFILMTALTSAVDVPEWRLLAPVFAAFVLAAGIRR